MIVDAVTAGRIGWEWLRDAVAPAGAFGRACDEQIGTYGPGDESRARDELRRCIDLRETLAPDAVAHLRAALRAIPDPTPIVARARAGDPLTDVDLYELLRFADGVAAFTARWDAAGGPPELRPDGTIEALRTRLAPGRTANGFYLSDDFAAQLGPPRAELRAADERVDAQRRELAERVARATGVLPASDEFVLLRDVFDGELPDGIALLRATPTYRSVMLVLDDTPRLRAADAVAQIESTVRRALAEEIARDAAAIAAATGSLGVLDRLLSRVAFVQRWGGCVPEFEPDFIRVTEAIFAPLADALAAQQRRYTPLSFELAGSAVLTGPNMGGKSAALATAGFLCACVALGVPPPAQHASLPPIETILWLGSGAPSAPATRLLSSFAVEVVHARDALAVASPQTLILIDEFARTTGPREGRALLVALLEGLRTRGALVFAATHFPGIAAGADAVALRIAGLGTAPDPRAGGDLERALDAINLAMDYRIVCGDAAPDASEALALAQLLGLDAGVVDRARALYAADTEL